MNRRRITRRDVMWWSLGLAGVASSGEFCRAAADERSSVPTRKGFFSHRELALVSQVVETMIPATDTPGAYAANVHFFLDGLMAEWALPDTQQEFLSLLLDIQAAAQQRFGSPFSSLTPEQRLQTVSAFDEAAFELPREGLTTEHKTKTHPFARFKALVFLGYYHSEIGATQELQFQSVPGHYEPCASLASVGRAWVGEYWEMLAYGKMLSP